MKNLIFFQFWAAIVSAYVSFEDWHPAQAGEVRSPCPVLNSLANHGIIPRDGRNLTEPMLVNALGEALNIDAKVASALANAGISVSADPATKAFDLDDLNKHNAIEHDGSLSRKDFDLGGESQAFAPCVFDETVSYYDNAEEVGIPEVAAARWGRIQSSKANNPNFVYGDAQKFPSYFESSAYFQILKNADTDTALVSWIKIFFSQERFPYAEGWRPVNHIDPNSINQTVSQLAEFTPETPPVGGF